VTSEEPFEAYIVLVRRAVDGDDYVAESGDPQVAAMGDTPVDALAAFVDGWRAQLEQQQ
jgi:hypothetical protein